MERTRTLGEKEEFKYLGILEAGIIKHVVMKEKNKKRVPQTNRKTSRNQAFQKKSCCILTLTEPSCSSCVNRQIAMRGCKQLTWVVNWKWIGITWIANRKRFGVVILYIHGCPRQIRPVSQSHSHVSLRDTESRQRPASVQSRIVPPPNGREAEMLSEALNMAQEDMGQYSSPPSVISLKFTVKFIPVREK